MSAHHHHHPHEGHKSGSPAKKPLHHDWRFYAAGFFILVALLLFIFSGNLAFSPSALPQPSPSDGVAR